MALQDFESELRSLIERAEKRLNGEDYRTFLDTADTEVSAAKDEFDFEENDG